MPFSIDCLILRVTVPNHLNRSVNILSYALPGCCATIGDAYHLTPAGSVHVISMENSCVYARQESFHQLQVQWNLYLQVGHLHAIWLFPIPSMFGHGAPLIISILFYPTPRQGPDKRYHAFDTSTNFRKHL